MSDFYIKLGHGTVIVAFLAWLCGCTFAYIRDCRQAVSAVERNAGRTVVLDGRRR